MSKNNSSVLTTGAMILAIAVLTEISVADEPPSPASQPVNTWIKRSPLPLPDGPVSPQMGYEGACVWDNRHQLLVRYGGHNQGGGGEQGAEVWTYRFAGKAGTQPPLVKPPEHPPIIEDVVVSVVGRNRVEVTWEPPAINPPARSHVERAVVEVWSDDQLVQLKKNTPPLELPTVGAIRRIGAFKQLTTGPIATTSFADDQLDFAMPAAIDEEPVYENNLPDDHLDRLGREYRSTVFAYRIRAVNANGDAGGPSSAVFTIPSSPQNLFAREDGETCQLKWSANREQGIAGYRVYRLDGRWDADPVSRLTPEPQTDTTFSDNTAGTKTRRYYIVAVDALGQEGFPSSPVWFQREWQTYYTPFISEWHQ